MNQKFFLNKQKKDKKDEDLSEKTPTTSESKEPQHKVGLSTLIMEVQKTAFKNRSELLDFQGSVKKISQVLKNKQRATRRNVKSQIESSFKKFKSALDSEWETVNTIFHAFEEGKQPAVYEDLVEWLEYINEIFPKHLELIQGIFKELKEDICEDPFINRLAGSFLVALSRDDQEAELAIVRFSRSESKLKIVWFSDLGQGQEKKDLLVSFLLGKSVSFFLTDPQAKKLAFQETLKNKKFVISE